MRNKKIFLAFCLLCALFVFFNSCKKGSGQGGRATIKGKVWVKKYNADFSKLLFEYYGTNDDVYIIYGDEVTFGDHVKTNYDGTYEFRYLRKGKYKVYVYSIDSTLIPVFPATLDPTPPNIAYIKDITVNERKQNIDVGTLTIFRN